MKKKLNIEQYIELLANVANGHRHKHYTRTVELAKFYKSMFTDTELDSYITAYKPRETDEQKKQRINITKACCKSTCNRAMRPFDEVPRVDNVINEIKYNTEKSDDKLAKLYERLNYFFGNASVKSYLNIRFKYFQCFDPNSFLVVEMMNEDNSIWTYPLEVSAHQAVDFGLVNGDLQYLIVEHSEIKKTTKGKFVARKLTLYAADTAIVMLSTPTDGSTYDVPEGFEMITITNDQKESVWYIRTYQTGSKVCPAVRVGYILDPETDLETFISPIETARNTLLDLINAKSEYDLSLALHGFYKMYQYLPACEAKNDHGQSCKNGKIGLQTCDTCKGTGVKIHTSSQEIIALQLPKQDDRMRETHIPINEMVHYVSIPTDLIEMQNARVEKLKRDVRLAIFDVDVTEKGNVTATATEKRIELNSVYNVLSDFANKYSEIYKFIVYQTSIYMQIDSGLSVTHVFPKDFKLESINDLLTQNKSAQEAGVSDSITDAIETKLLQKLYADDPISFQRAKVKSSFLPFKGKTETERISIIAMLPPNDAERILYLYFDKIFAAIEDKQPLFYQMTRPNLQKMVDTEVDNLKSNIIIA